MVAVEMWADLAVGGVGHCRLTGVEAVGTVGLLSGSCRDGLSSCRAGAQGPDFFLFFAGDESTTSTTNHMILEQVYSSLGSPLPTSRETYALTAHETIVRRDRDMVERSHTRRTSKASSH